MPWVTTCQHFTAFGWGMGVPPPNNDWPGQPGDSGSPQMLPMPDGELVLWGGTSGQVVSTTMQAYRDLLTGAGGIKHEQLPDSDH